ncbi:MAG: hypothetical protein KJ587_05395 [Alphaproteobacteria bacterium]|nr:hypothetical protein [Alphaproteobacteria bacterium]
MESMKGGPVLTQRIVTLQGGSDKLTAPCAMSQKETGKHRLVSGSEIRHHPAEGA